MIKGVCSSSGNIMTFWKTNFNMPVPYLFGGCSNCTEGFMDARYGSIGATSTSLSGFYPGYEVALADGLYNWFVSEGSCLNGIGRLNLCWYRGATPIGGLNQTICINMSSGVGTQCCTWFENMTNTGIAGWEICCNGIFCTKAEVTNVSGDDLSIGACSICVEFGSVPAVSQCSSSLRGSIWVEGNNLNYINANCWEHVMVGDSQGAAGANTDGTIWIDNAHYLHWVGGDCNNYRAKWRICQFCSSFSNGSPANPAPGVSCKGALWVDNEFGYTHLSYIGCDGNKYLTGAACCPYVVP